MKRGIILFGMILTMMLTAAQDFYTVQVRSLSSETPLTMDELDAGMWQHKVNGLTKCFMGRFDTYDQAKAAVQPIKSQYPGAFVVSSDKIFNSAAVVAKPIEPAKPTEPEAPAQPVVEKAPVQTKVDNSIEVLTIQVAAYRYPLYTKEFTLEGKVMEFYCSDNMYRYTVGRFDSREQAELELEKVRKSGYPDAFLVDYKKYEVYRLE